MLRLIQPTYLQVNTTRKFHKKLPKHTEILLESTVRFWLKES
jgi:hypothetical protein